MVLSPGTKVDFPLGEEQGNNSLFLMRNSKENRRKSPVFDFVIRLKLLNECPDLFELAVAYCPM